MGYSRDQIKLLREVYTDCARTTEEDRCEAVEKIMDCISEAYEDRNTNVMKKLYNYVKNKTTGSK